MVEETGRMITIRELYEKGGVPLSVSDFITKPDPCTNRRIFMPQPTVPHYLMDEEIANKADTLLEQCINEVGIYGDRVSKRNSDEFTSAADAFKNLTGVDPWEVIVESRRRLFERDF